MVASIWMHDLSVFALSCSIVHYKHVWDTSLQLFVSLGNKQTKIVYVGNIIFDN